MKIAILFMIVITLTLTLVACGPTTSLPEASNGELCVKNEGTWLAEHNECEGVNMDDCANMGGEFEPCASACRHDPEAVACTMQCILV